MTLRPRQKDDMQTNMDNCKKQLNRQSETF